MEVQSMKQGTQSRCSGITLRDKVAREVGGGFRTTGTCVYLGLIHVDGCQNTSQYCKVIILQFKNKQTNKKEHVWEVLHVQQKSTDLRPAL